MFGVSTDFFRDPSYRFHKALVLEHTFPGYIRRWISATTGTILLLYIAFTLAPYVQGRLAGGVTLPVPYTGALEHETVTLPAAQNIAIPKSVQISTVIPYIGGTTIPLSSNNPIGNGIFMISLAVWLAMKMLWFYFRSQYYLVEALLERGKTGAQTPYTTPNYEVCDIFYVTRYGDLAKSFIRSKYGKRILRRCGIDDETAERYLATRTRVVDFYKLESDLRHVFTLRDLTQKIVQLDSELRQFLFELGIREPELIGAAEWVERAIKKKKQKKRYWGKVALGQSPSFGADFSYGAAYTLGKYSRDLSREAISGGSHFRFVYGKEEIKQLEIILSRSKEANALLVGEEGTGKMDVILDFARDIMNGYVNPALHHKRVMAFDAKSFVAGMRSKHELETGLIRLMNDAVKAGNIILVIEDLPGFLQGGWALDADVFGILNPYLSGSDIQIIATADNARFHQFLEPNNAIMQRFEKIMLVEPAEEATIRILEEVAESAERKNKIFFTYPAIAEIVKSAEQYMTSGVMPDKAIDLLVELVPTMLARGEHLIEKTDVLAFVHEKTKIPVGAISEEERARLMNLETLIKQLVIGQEHAADMIASAMRRSRAGVRNPNKPNGAFLFLGPTGVGKTETAKALATVYFGAEGAMSRIDMSEYQGADGLERMIGSMDGTPGTLAVMLKEQPYGVILLDEFEKTNPKVLDLFLQILDEGIFHDAQGKKVNARNTIFIATSNAGAAEIREAMKAGVNLIDAQKDIIDKIILSGKLKPELLNRFDGVILFHPLTVDDYKKIAELMLKKLQKRLREKSINLIINDALVDALLYHGVDPDFGARPMARAIQDVVEEKVAEWIIAGKLHPGSTLEFSRDDFPELGTRSAEELLHAPTVPRTAGDAPQFHSIAR